MLIFSDYPGARGRLYAETVFVDPAWQVSRFYLKAGGPIVDASGRSCLTGFVDFQRGCKPIPRAQSFDQYFFRIFGGKPILIQDQVLGVPRLAPCPPKIRTEPFASP